MTEELAALRRARVWRDSLAPLAAPDGLDVEFAVRLGVRDPQVLVRLIWNDTQSLARHFFDLVDAVEDDSLDAPTQAESQVADPGQASQGDSGAAHGQTSDDDPRYADLLAYVNAQQSEGLDLPWDEAWMARALADPVTTLDGLPSRVARKHKSKLSSILLRAGSTAVDSGADSGAEPGQFTNEPDVHAHHRAENGIHFSSDASGQLGLSWSAAPGYAYFKVYAGVDGKVPRLFEGLLVAGTESHTAVDGQVVFGRGRRHYAVWAYQGTDQSAARGSRPVLWARGTAVQPVQDVDLNVTGNDVAGTWVVAEGIERVEVYRLPRPNDIPLTHLPEGYLRSGSLPQENLTGFVDEDLRAGDYDYRIYTLSTTDGHPLRSTAVQIVTTVKVPVPAVEGLRVEVVHRPKASFDISWAPPLGQECSVEIHLRRDEPKAGIGRRELDAEGLEREGFTTKTRQSFPQMQREDGRVGFSVEWPADVDRVHVTAVTKLGAAYRVGSTEVRTRARDITSARIVERVDEQFLVFGWPSGADWVYVHQASLDAGGTDPSGWQKLREVSKSRHEKYGGLHLPPLPSRGCHLALVGVAFQGGQQTAGEFKILTYNGLTRLWYRFEEEFFSVGRFKKKEVSAGWKLVVRADQAIDIPVVLVKRSDRLPLHHRDGTELRVAPLRLEAGEEKTVWSGLQSGGELAGFVRLFAQATDADQLRYAVLDPATGLEWGG